MSKKHYYQKLDSQISYEFEQLYNKILRREEYLLEKDALGNALLFGSEDDLYYKNGSLFNVNKLSDDSENKEHEKMIKLLYKALKILKDKHPSEYELIQLYYFSDSKITQQEIGKRKNVSKQAVQKALKRACNHLKKYIIMHKEED